MSSTGIIFNIQRFSVNDGPGIRTTVFMKGCPLRCWWCHNPEGIGFEPEVNGRTGIGNYYTVDELFEKIVKDRIFYEESEGGVTFSGGEPLSQIDFLTKILDKCNSTGVHTVVDTSGYVNKTLLKEITDKTDLFLYDLKLMDPVQHLKFTEVSNTEILDNLGYLLSKKAEVIIRIPMIPEITATIENMKAIRDFLNKYDNKPTIHLLPYHKIAEGKYDKYGLKNKMNGSRELTEKEIVESKLIFINSGFDVKIGG
ncbi:MAG: glycyl-radical enzyme activating protein [Bacteroidales bacterium]|nr:glycyl-radical enzyme activating protein [Bacteroidales bacterium]